MNSDLAVRNPYFLFGSVHRLNIEIHGRRPNNFHDRRGHDAVRIRRCLKESVDSTGSHFDPFPVDPVARDIRRKPPYSSQNLICFFFSSHTLFLYIFNRAIIGCPEKKTCLCPMKKIHLSKKEPHI